MVTICTTTLTFTNSTFCPHRVFMCFVWISEQTAIISLYTINWLVCTTETECVYCAVRTGSLNITQFKFYWKIRGSLCSIPGQSMSDCGGRSGTGTVFLRILCFSTVSIFPTMLHTYLSLHDALTRVRLGTSQNAIRGVFKKKPNFLISAPTSTESALRLLSAPSVRFWQQTAICPVSLWALRHVSVPSRNVTFQ